MPRVAEISVAVPLEQPNLIRQYTRAVRWLTLRGRRLRDQARVLYHSAHRGTDDRAQAPRRFTVAALEGTV
jgi:hypothetical protein